MPRRFSNPPIGNRTLAAATLSLAAILVFGSFILQPVVAGAGAGRATQAGPTAAEVQAMIDSAVASKVDSSALPAAVMASLPWATSAPPTEMVAGTAGSANTIRRGDAIPTTTNRSGMTVTDGSGNWSITWRNQDGTAAPMASAPLVIPVPVVANMQNVECAPMTRTTTGATGRCWTTQALPVQTQLTGITLLSALVTGVNNLLASISGYNTTVPAPAGVTVQVFARPAIQPTS